jgi:hypothetical protein
MQAAVPNIAANVAAANANFGKSPAAVSIGRVLDMTSEEDKKLYYHGTSRFVAKNELFDWHWCLPATGGKCDSCWRVHKLSQCRGVAAPGQNRNRGANAESNEHQLQMMQALTMVLMENEEDEVMDESDF